MGDRNLPVIEVWVPGTPRPGGSKKAFRHPHTGQIIVTDDAKQNREWKSSVADFARQAWPGGPVGVPLAVEVTFYVLRPRGHYGSGKNAHRLLPSAPPYPTVKPDVTKLWRSTEDALTGVLWRDDAQVVQQLVTKLYGDAPGAMIRVTPMADPVAEPPEAPLFAGTEREDP